MSFPDFRQIRPSSEEHGVSSSDSSQPTSESRRPRGDTYTPTKSSGSSPKRRRVLGLVTRNACINCKNARAKCNGNNPCNRCAKRNETSECIYIIHIKHVKEELVKQIEKLRAQERVTEQILQALSTNNKVPEIVECLQSGETYENIVGLLARSPLVDPETLPSIEFRHSKYDSSDHETGGVGASKRFWAFLVTIIIRYIRSLFGHLTFVVNSHNYLKTKLPVL